jgi:hypothetical protein
MKRALERDLIPTSGPKPIERDGRRERGSLQCDLAMQAWGWGLVEGDSKKYRECVTHIRGAQSWLSGSLEDWIGEWKTGPGPIGGAGKAVKVMRQMASLPFEAQASTQSACQGRPPLPQANTTTSFPRPGACWPARLPTPAQVTITMEKSGFQSLV